MADKDKIKIPHKLSKQFASFYANGMFISGPTTDGMFHLTFYADAVGIKSETGTPISDTGQYAVSIEQDDTIQLREDQTRVYVSQGTLRSIYDLLKQKVSPDKKQ